MYIYNIYIIYIYIHIYSYIYTHYQNGKEKKMKLVRVSCKFALQFHPVLNELMLWIQ